MLSRREDLADRLWPDKLQELQDWFSRSLSVPIVVVEPSGRPLTACEDLSQYCRHFTRRVPLCRPCLDCGRGEEVDESPELAHDPAPRGPSLHHCPLGLADVSAPVYAAGEVIGYLLSPQVVVSASADAGAGDGRPSAPADECATLLARASNLPAAELARVESGLAAAAWLLGALASTRRRNLRLAERLREQSRWRQQHAVTDPVTGVANRRRMMEMLAAEVRRARRYRRSMSVAALEIESLRQINSEFGHDVGDAVLAAVSQCLTTTLRQTDLVGRVSGEGFVVLLPETARNQALVALERVAAAVDDLNASGELPVEVRTAVGIVDFVLEPEEMLLAAREAVTLARQAGAPAVHPG